MADNIYQALLITDKFFVNGASDYIYQDSYQTCRNGISICNFGNGYVFVIFWAKCGLCCLDTFPKSWDIDKKCLKWGTVALKCHLQNLIRPKICGTYPLCVSPPFQFIKCWMVFQAPLVGVSCSLAIMYGWLAFSSLW